MRKRNMAVILILIFLLLSIGCQKKEAIKIGFSVGLTGFLADEGVSARNGFYLAIEEINEIDGVGGRLLEPIIKDDESNVDKAIEVDTEFYNEGVSLIVGHLLSSTAPAIEKGMADYGHLYISPTMSTAELSNKKDRFFRVIGDSHLMAEGIYELIRLDNKCSNIAIIYDGNNIGYTGSIKNDLVTNIEKDSYNLAALIEYKDGDDYSQIIDKLKESNADGVVMITSSVATANILQQIDLAELDICRFTSTWALSSELIYKGGKATEGLYGVAFYDIGSQNEKFIEFVSNYRERFNEEPSSTSLFSYDATYLMYNAILKAESTNVNDVEDALNNMEQFLGVSENFHLNEFGDAVRPYVKIQITNGEMKRVK